MKPICPTCNAGIPDKNVNLAEGVAHCPACGEYHRLSLLLRDSVAATRIAKPDNIGVQHYRDADSMGFIIPRNGMKQGSWFFILFSVFWNTFSWLGFISTIQDGDTVGSLFLLIFISVGLFLAGVTIYMIFGETTIAVDQQEISVIWAVSVVRWRKSAPLDEISEIDEGELYQQNYKPIYGVRVHQGKKKLSFGSTLSEDERRWMIGELRDFKASASQDV